MKIPLRLFQQEAKKFLKDLPIELTRYGRVIAVVYSPGGPAKKISETPEKILPETPDYDFRLCKHGARIGICKHGCVR